jgi:aryl-alcohol dehydrogenase-like predicted oxidoreductase
MERIELQPGYSISRVIKGGWHLAGGHGAVNEKEALEDMRQFVKAGITTFDCADIYTGVENLIGQFLKTYGDEIRSGDLDPIQIHTKYVPDYEALTNLKKEDTTRVIDRSLARLGVDRLDLVQFAWWDYAIPGYLETAMHLYDLQKSGKIRYVGVTNFDSAHIEEMVDAGITLMANQVQYSLLDHRVEHHLQDLAQRHEIPFLCYGTLAGGFLSDRYLGVPDPKPPLENRSLTKYRLIIDEFGGYALYQKLLQVVRGIADKHEVGIAEVASKYCLQKPMVAGVIIGARNSRHLKGLQQLERFSLDEGDLQNIAQVINLSQGPKGRFYELERDKKGKHGAIMKYNLNKTEN